jgi:hypothetical protein
MAVTINYFYQFIFDKFEDLISTLMEYENDITVYLTSFEDEVFGIFVIRMERAGVEQQQMTLSFEIFVLAMNAAPNHSSYIEDDSASVINNEQDTAGIITCRDVSPVITSEVETAGDVMVSESGEGAVTLSLLGGTGDGPAVGKEVVGVAGAATKPRRNRLATAWQRSKRALRSCCGCLFPCRRR